MVAIRKPEELGPPPRDGLPTRRIAQHSTQKSYYVCRYAEVAATATKNSFRGGRAYVDLLAASGVCEHKDTGDLSWGSALLAAQVSNPFDLYVLNDIDPSMSDALAERIFNLGIPGASVLRLDLTSRRAHQHTRELAAIVSPFGPKFVVMTGNANEAPVYVKELLAPLGRRRYQLAVIDPQSAIFHWEALENLAAWERAMDVITLFPDAMDLSRGLAYYLNSEKAGRKMDAYFPGPPERWREIARSRPKRAEHELRVFYEQEMHRRLGFKIGQPRGVGLMKRPLYHLVFGSKSSLGIKLWSEINRRSHGGQDELFLDGI